MATYSAQTLNNPNPIARFAHRKRLARALALVRAQGGVRKLLDYGCGSGAFISAIQGVNDIAAFGYEPFMSERHALDLPIYHDLDLVALHGPFDLITVFETIEHLRDDELGTVLFQADRLLSERGRLLFSAPIEVGPALLLKELNRCITHRRPPEHGFGELLLAAIVGRSARRTADIKSSHKGFDFRAAIAFLEKNFGPVTISGYGPLPLSTWYGNSQVFFWLDRRPQTTGRHN